MNDRRTFLKLLAAAAATTVHSNDTLAAQTPAAAPSTSAIKKAVLISMLPKDRPYAERFTMAREAGFDAIEM